MCILYIAVDWQRFNVGNIISNFPVHPLTCERRVCMGFLLLLLLLYAHAPVNRKTETFSL